MARVRLLIADQNPAIRQTLADLVQEHYDVVGTLADGKSVLREVESTKPAIVLLGVSFEGTSGFEIARRLLQADWKPRIIFVSLHESRDLVQAALRIGASGFVFMSRLLDDLPVAVDAASQGKIFHPTM